MFCFIISVLIQVKPERCNGSVLRLTWNPINLQITNEAQDFHIDVSKIFFRCTLQWCRS